MNFVSLFSQLATIRISEKSSHKFKIINKCQCPLPQLKHIQCSAADMFSSILQTQVLEQYIIIHQIRIQTINLISAILNQAIQILCIFTFKFIVYFQCDRKKDNISFLSNSCNKPEIYGLMSNDVLRTIYTFQYGSYFPLKPYIFVTFIWLFTHLPQKVKANNIP